LAVEKSLGPAGAQRAQSAITALQNEMNAVQKLKQEYEEMRKSHATTNR
jgi:hypothetical protein